QLGIDLIDERTTVFERGLSLDFLEHDCTSHPARLPVGLTQWLKATVIFWTRTLHDSDAYRDPRLAWCVPWARIGASSESLDFPHLVPKAPAPPGLSFTPVGHASRAQSVCGRQKQNHSQADDSDV